MVVRTHLATPDTLQARKPHESLHRAAGYCNAFAVQLVPDLVRAVDLHVGLPDSIDQRQQDFILLGTHTTQFWVSQSGGMATIT